MSNHQSYQSPKIADTRLVTPTFVRDELLKCFQSANKEFMSAVNPPVPSDREIQQQVNQFVSSAFQSCGAKIDEPTKDGIIAAIEQCKKNAKEMMGEKGKDIINHQYEEMMKTVRLLK
jgi:hypothetical protein